MAPFGRNFLKARLKNRAKDTEDSPGEEVQVLVCEEEKVVCGVTKHTTCADVVQALLDDHKNVPEAKVLLHGEAKEFCLLERWRGFERALPPLTRILRLWNAWGDQKPFIHFILVKISEFVPAASKAAKRTSKSRGAKPKRWERGPAHYAKTLPAVRQKRLVKKAFRKLERIRKGESSEGSEEIDGMVQLIISQDHTIRQQLQRIRQMDLDIQKAEQENQQTSTPRSSLTESAVPSMSGREQEVRDFLYTGDGLQQLEEQIQRHRELIQQLCCDIDEELTRSAWTPGGGEAEGAAAAGPGSTLDLFSPPSSPPGAAGVESLREELAASMRHGLALHGLAQELDRDLQHHSAALLARSQEYQQLATQLSSLDLGGPGGPGGAGGSDGVGVPSQVCVKSAGRCGVPPQTPGKLRGTRSPADATDTDSDTGISSTHSQDSLTPCVERPPPLDTDV